MSSRGQQRCRCSWRLPDPHLHCCGHPPLPALQPRLIDNRAVVYAVGSAFVAAGYVGLVVVLGGLAGARAGGFWASLLATVVVALAFQPLRKGLSRFADRVAYGARAVPYEALADFSRRLGDAPAPQTLLPAVAAAAGQMVSARRATVSLMVQGVETEAATWPAGTPEHGVSLEVAVRDAGEVLGRHRRLVAAGTPGPRRRDPAAAGSGGPRASGVPQRLSRGGGPPRVSPRSTKGRGSSSRHADGYWRHAMRSADDWKRRSSERSSLCSTCSPSGMRRLQAAAEAGLPLTGVQDLIDEVTRALETLRGLSRGMLPTQRARAGLGPALACLPRCSFAPRSRWSWTTPREGVGSALPRRPQRTSAASKPRLTAPRAVASSSASRTAISPCTSTGCRPRVWTCSGWTTASRPWPGLSSHGREESSQCGSPSSTWRWYPSWPAAADPGRPGPGRTAAQLALSRTSLGRGDGGRTVSR